MRFVAAVIIRMFVWAYSRLPAREVVEMHKALNVTPRRSKSSKSSEKPETKTVNERFNDLLQRMSLQRENQSKPRTVYYGSEIIGVQPEAQPLVLSDDTFALGARVVTKPVVCETLAEVERVRKSNLEALRAAPRSDSFPLVLADEEVDGLLAREDFAEVSDLGYIIEDPGTPGIAYTGGLPENRDHNARFHPVRARGLQWDHGEFHELLVEMSPFRRGWLSINHVMSQMQWSVQPAEIPEDHPDYAALKEQADEQARFTERAIIENIYGGWKKLLREANYAAVGGFVVFVEVWHGPDSDEAGSLRKLSFRFPKQVKEWIVHPTSGELLAVVFVEPEGGEYTVRAENLLLYSFEGLGNDFEGMALTRSVVIWSDVLKLLTQLEAVAAEKWGNAWAWASRENEQGAPFGESEREEIRDIIRDAIAEDDPVITLPDNTKIELTSPQGVVPNFDTAKRFALERIASIWKSEASLIALGTTGAFSARESAVDEQTAFAQYFASLISDGLNGKNNTPHTGTIKKMVDLKYGGPPLPGAYPTLTSSLGQREDPDRFGNLLQGAQAGLIEINGDVKDHVHEMLQIPAREKKEKVVGGSGIQLNGAQIKSLESMVQNVALGQLPRDAAVAMIARAFQIDADAADDMVGSAGKGFQPSVEGESAPPTPAAQSLPPAVLADNADVAFTPLVLADFDADEATSFLDEAENRLAAELAKVMREHREFWRSALDQERRSNDFSADEITAQATIARDTMLPRYVDAATAALVGVATGGAKALLTQIGAKGEDVMTSLQNASTAVQLKARGLAEEVFNRVNGLMIDRFTQFARGESTITLPVLETSTLKSIASKGVSTAYNAGRDIVADELDQVAPEGAPKIIAERSSVLDSSTCSTCRELDGARAEFKSARYYDLSPPNKCEGWDRCRCIWTYILPDELTDTITEL